MGEWHIASIAAPTIEDDGEEEALSPPQPEPVVISPKQLVVSPGRSSTAHPQLKAQKARGRTQSHLGQRKQGLSLEIAKLPGVNVGRATVSRFANGEINVAIHGIHYPTYVPYLMECLNRASARRGVVGRCTHVFPLVLWMRPGSSS